MKHSTLRAILLLAALAPIAEYAKQLAEFYKLPLDESSLPHAPARR